MKTIKQFYLPVRQTIITIIVCVAVVAGVSLVYSWTGPTAAPPGGNVAAPINVGTTAQYKSGALGIGGLLQTSSFQLTTGAGTGKVLTSDASGLASWQTGGTGGLTGSGSTNYISKWTGSTSLGNSTIFDDGTKVGFATTGLSPGTAKVHISTPDYQTAGLYWGVGSTPVGFLGVREGNNALIGAHWAGGGSMYFRTGNYDRMMITSAGNVGIGTANPSQKLEVSGNMKVNGLYFGLNSTAPYGAPGFAVANNGITTAVRTDNFNVINAYSGGYANVWANDYYIGATGKWASQLGGGGSTEKAWMTMTECYALSCPSGWAQYTSWSRGAGTCPWAFGNSNYSETFTVCYKSF